MNSINRLWDSAYRLYGWVGPNLIRLTGDFQDDHNRLQFVLFDVVGKNRLRIIAALRLKSSPISDSHDD
jgi:hypothetical protein